MTTVPRPTKSDLLGAAFASLDESVIRWAQLRDRDHQVVGGDVDLLIHPNDADRLDAALGAVGFARVRTWRHGYHRFFVAYDERVDEWLKLDVVTRLAFRTGGELPAQVVGAVLARAQRDARGMHLLPEDEFWALLLHCLLDRGSVPPRHMHRLQQLASGVRPTGPIFSILPAAEHTLASAVEFARTGEAAALGRLAREIDAALARPAFARRLSRSAGAALAPLIRMVRRPGISVALLGPDGAGKSTLIASLSDRFYFPVRSYYLGFYAASPERAPGTGDTSPNLFGLLRMAWRAYLRGAVDRLRGRLVLFDRYGYDVLMPSRRGRITWKRRARRLLIGRLSPRPDLVVILDAAPSELMARKNEHSIETLVRQRNAYLSLAENLRVRVPVRVVDAGQDAATVHRQVTTLLWDSFAQRRQG